MAILRTDRDEELQLSCYDAILRIEGGLNAHHKKPPTIDFGSDAVVLRSSSPIPLDCRGVTWSAEHRESEHEASLQHYAAIELPPGRADAEAAAELADRFQAELVLGAVPIPRRGGTARKGLFVRLAPMPPNRPAPRAQVFRAPLLRQLQKLERECSAIEQKNRELAGAVEAAERAIDAAERAVAEDPSAKNAQALDAAMSKWRVAKVVRQGKTLPVPAEKRSSIERLRATLRQLDGSRPCFLTGQQTQGLPDGATLPDFAALAARVAHGAPGWGWTWRSRRPGPLAGDRGPLNLGGHEPAPNGGDTGHCCFAYDVTGIDEPRKLFELLVARCVAHRIAGGWRVIVALSRPATDDELAAVVAALNIGTERYSIWGELAAGAGVFDLDNVPPVDVDQVLAGTLQPSEAS